MVQKRQLRKGVLVRGEVDCEARWYGTRTALSECKDLRKKSRRSDLVQKAKEISIERGVEVDLL